MSLRKFIRTPHTEPSVGLMWRRPYLSAIVFGLMGWVKGESEMISPFYFGVVSGWLGKLNCYLYAINVTSMDQQQKVSHLRALYHLACADKIFTDVEALYIKNVAEHMGIPLDQLSSLDPYEPSLELPDREYKNYVLFHRLALIVMIDNALNERERHYCFNLGIKMGLHPNAIGEIIDYIESAGTSDSKASEVMAIFKKYLS
ncbi:MAG TPA: hypothetical protein VFZ52_18345 [Chryseolinea sp.]